MQLIWIRALIYLPSPVNLTVAKCYTALIGGVCWMSAPESVGVGESAGVRRAANIEGDLITRLG